VRALVHHVGLRSFLLTEMVARMAKQILRRRFRVSLKPGGFNHGGVSDRSQAQGDGNLDEEVSMIQIVCDLFNEILCSDDPAFNEINCSDDPCISSHKDGQTQSDSPFPAAGETEDKPIYSTVEDAFSEEKEEVNGEEEDLGKKGTAPLPLSSPPTKQQQAKQLPEGRSHTSSAQVVETMLESKFWDEAWKQAFEEKFYLALQGDEKTAGRYPLGQPRSLTNVVDIKLLLLRISEMCGVTLRKDTHALLQNPEPLPRDFEVFFKSLLSLPVMPLFYSSILPCPLCFHVLRSLYSPMWRVSHQQ